MQTLRQEHACVKGDIYKKLSWVLLKACTPGKDGGDDDDDDDEEDGNGGGGGGGLIVITKQATSRRDERTDTARNN